MPRVRGFLFVLLQVRCITDSCAESQAHSQQAVS